MNIINEYYCWWLVFDVYIFCSTFFRCSDQEWSVWSEMIVFPRESVWQREKRTTKSIPLPNNWGLASGVDRIPRLSIILFLWLFYNSLFSVASQMHEVHSEVFRLQPIQIVDNLVLEWASKVWRLSWQPWYLIGLPKYEDYLEGSCTIYVLFDIESPFRHHFVHSSFMKLRLYVCIRRILNKIPFTACLHS